MVTLGLDLLKAKLVDDLQDNSFGIVKSRDIDDHFIIAHPHLKWDSGLRHVIIFADMWLLRSILLANVKLSDIVIED